MSKHASTFDLLEVLCVAQEHIYDLNENKRVDVINAHMKKFAVSINRKAISAKERIEKQIIPNIEKTLIEVNEQIFKLMEKINENQLALINEQELDTLLIEYKILFWLKNFGLFALSLSTAGVIFGLITQNHGTSTPIYGMYLYIFFKKN